MKLLSATLIAMALTAPLLAHDVSCKDGSCSMTSLEEIKATEHAYGTIDTSGLRAIMKSGTPYVLLDARTGKWDDGQRIPGAKSLSYEANADEAAKVIPNKNTLVITYCSNTHCPASAALADQLITLGYTNILKYPEGIQGWLSAGNKVENVK